MARNMSSNQQDGIELSQILREAPLPLSEAVPVHGNELSNADAVSIDRDSIFKLASCSLSFFCAGINDGSLGTLIPYFRQSYDIDLGLVTIIYGASFAGWFISGLTNSILLHYIPIGAILLLGAVLQLLAHALRFWVPPFPLYCVAFLLASAGQGYQDSYSNTFVSTVKGAHRWLGLVHAMYALGLLVAPFAANAIASSGGERKWALYYLFPSALGVINFVAVFFAFGDFLKRSKSGVADVQQGSSTQQENSGPVDNQRKSFSMAVKDSTDALRMPGVWQLSLWFFFYLGAALTAGGWLVQYLVDVRHGVLSEMGYVPTALYGGMFLGRLLLAEPTHRYGERNMIILYSALWIACQLVFWFVPNIGADIAMVALIGLCSGPFFATGISIGSKLFNSKHKASALGFVFIAAQAGGALFPTLTGLVADRAGVKVLQPIVVGLIAAAVGTWLIIPRKSNEDVE